MTSTTAEKTTSAAEEEEFDFEFAEGSSAAKAAAKKSGGTNFARVKYIDQMLDGSPAGEASGEDRVWLRLLTDYEASPEDGVTGFITVLVHRAVPTKPKPASEDADRNWPKAMTAVCRHDDAVKAKFNGECWIHENVKDKFKPGQPHKATPRTYAIAVQREPIYGDGSEEMGGPRKKGQIIGFTDVTAEVAKTDEDGKVIKDKDDNVVTEIAPQYVVLTLAAKHFGPLETMGKMHGTVLDRDYLVIRKGESTDTTYEFIAADPIDIEGADGEPVRLDLRDREIREALYGDMPNLKRMIARLVSTDHYNRWFIPQEGDDVAPEGKGGKAPKSAGAASTATSADRMAAMRERLKAASQKKEPQAAETSE